MRMWQKLGLGIIALVLFLLFIAYLLPSQWKVERSILIAAPKSHIYPYLQDLKKWQIWTPWNSQKDPSMRITYSDPSSGKGARVTWEGEKAGSGTLQLHASDPQTGIRYTMHFGAFSNPTEGSIYLAAQDGGTRVTWHDEGTLGKNPIHRYFSLLLDAMLGNDFERGLARLKEIVEKRVL